MTQTSQTQAARCEAKQQVRQRLAAHGGDPKQEAIAAAIDALIALNPTPNPADQLELLQGNWRLISAPSFPDGERQRDGSYVYTLGRLAFNMFQPKDLRVVMNQKNDCGCE